MENTWELFAREIIKALEEHDKKYDTCYSCYLESKDKKAVLVLADIMQEVNRRLVWQKVPDTVQK